MKPIQNHKLLVDVDCPMCRLYANAFEAHGIIAPDTCSAYQTTNSELTSKIDMERAKNEIAFINTNTGTTIYGFDAIRFILLNWLPQLKVALNNSFVDFMGRKLYKFISMNRKVIAPSKIKIDHERHCIPNTNLTYRWIYIVIIALFSSVIINKYSVKLNEIIGQKSNLTRELIMCFGQIVWQYVFLKQLIKAKMIDYLGNMITVSMIGTLLLLPMLLLGGIFDLNGYCYIIYFMLVVGIMLIEHMRRCKILEIGYWPTISWLLYRMIFLSVLILLK
jgi:hypothetical protein